MKRSKEETFDIIYELMRDRLKVVGYIRPDHAWQICRGRTRNNRNGSPFTLDRLKHFHRLKNIFNLNFFTDDRRLQNT